MTAPASEQLIPIPQVDLNQSHVLPFDIYVRLPFSNKTILYRRAGSTVDQEKIENIAKRNLAFYVLKNDYTIYLNFAAKEILDVVLLKPADKDKMHKTAHQMLSSVFAQAVAAQAKELVHNMSDIVVSVLQNFNFEGSDSRKQVFSRFAAIAKEGTDFQKHPLHVSSTMIMIAFGLGVTDQRVLTEIGLAGLMHDIGLSQLPVFIVQDAHKYEQLNSVYKAMLRQHPEMSLDILKQRNIPVSKLMETIILQHHEEYNGNGYPAGLKGDQMHQFAQVLHIADDLDMMVSESTDSRSLKNNVERIFAKYKEEKTIEPKLLSMVERILL